MASKTCLIASHIHRYYSPVSLYRLLEVRVSEPKFNMAANPYLLAADNSPQLLTLLKEDPAAASSQDEHGYSLVHAAASYNHLDLLRVLIKEFKVNVDIVDEDHETPLFVVETEEAAKVLVEELKADIQHKNHEGQTAREKFVADDECPTVVSYLLHLEKDSSVTDNEFTRIPPLPETIPPPPDGLQVTLSTIDPAEIAAGEIDPDLRSRIEELAQRDDFYTPEGQASLRMLVEDALSRDEVGEQRHVRRRAE